VENTLVDFCNILDFVELGLLGGKQEFAKRLKVQASDITMLAEARELRELLGWHMLRRLKEDVVQATYRAYRIGRTKPITVYYPLSFSAGVANV